MRRLQGAARGGGSGGGGWQQEAAAAVTVLMELLFGASAAWTDADALRVQDMNGAATKGCPAPIGAMPLTRGLGY